MDACSHIWMPRASRQVSLNSPVYGFRLAISRIPGGRAIRGDSCSGWSVATAAKFREDRDKEFGSLASSRDGRYIYTRTLTAGSIMVIDAAPPHGAREVSYLGVELTQNACGPVILQFPKTEGERAAVQRGIGSRRSGRGRISALARCDHHEAAQDPARSLTAPSGRIGPWCRIPLGTRRAVSPTVRSLSPAARLRPRRLPYS